MNPAIPFALFFDPESDKRRERRLERFFQRKPEKARRLHCSGCRAVITREDERTRIDGGHEFSFTNPHGYLFHIGCFRQVPGCESIGDGNFAHAWFPGYAWTVAVCGNCRQHVGWYFRSEHDEFYGLILKRLMTL
jgi:hypothetical protein